MNSILQTKSTCSYGLNYYLNNPIIIRIRISFHIFNDFINQSTLEKCPVMNEQRTWHCTSQQHHSSSHIKITCTVLEISFRPPAFYFIFIFFHSFQWENNGVLLLSHSGTGFPLANWQLTPGLETDDRPHLTTLMAWKRLYLDKMWLIYCSKVFLDILRLLSK